MDTAQWPQDIVLVKPMDQELMTSSSSNNNNNNNSIGMMRPQHQQQAMERRVRPQKEQALNCPRCNSTNTKFCYYNNYSLTQPRYFCKTCRRYWTEGGSLRNVPVGGGSRKNKRSSSSTSASTPTTGAATAAVKKQLTEQNPKFHEGQDLNLAFPSVVPEFSNPAAASGALSAMELLRSTVGMSPFMAAMQPMGFGMQQDIRANSLSFPSLQNSVGFAGVNVNDSTANGRLLFPFEEPSRRGQLSSTPNNTEHFEQKQQQDTPGFWNGMMGGGGGGSW